MSEKTHANVAVRLPVDVVDRLEQMRADAGARSLAPIVERLVVSSIADADEIHLSRQPLTSERRHFFLRTQTVQQLRRLAEANKVDVGSLVFSILATHIPARPSRLVRTTADEIQAHAA